MSGSSVVSINMKAFEGTFRPSSAFSAVNLASSMMILFVVLLRWLIRSAKMRKYSEPYLR